MAGPTPTSARMQRLLQVVPRVVVDGGCGRGSPRTWPGPGPACPGTTVASAARPSTSGSTTGASASSISATSSSAGLGRGPRRDPGRSPEVWSPDRWVGGPGVRAPPPGEPAVGATATNPIRVSNRHRRRRVRSRWPWLRQPTWRCRTVDHWNSAPRPRPRNAPASRSETRVGWTSRRECTCGEGRPRSRSPAVTWRRRSCPRSACSARRCAMAATSCWSCRTGSPATEPVTRPASRCSRRGPTASAGAATRSRAVTVDLDRLDLHTDDNGLPIHGTMTAQPGWEIVRLEQASLSVRFDYAGTADLMAAFPFPHELVIDIVPRRPAPADDDDAAADRRCRGPGCFGWHPYLRIPRVARRSWRLVLPARDHVELDARGLPTGRSTAASARVARHRRPDLRRSLRVAGAMRSWPRRRRPAGDVSYEGYPVSPRSSCPRTGRSPASRRWSPVRTRSCPATARWSEPGEVHVARFAITPSRTR